jgi:hypothetical protein
MLDNFFEAFCLPVKLYNFATGSLSRNQTSLALSHFCELDVGGEGSATFKMLRRKSKTQFVKQELNTL